MYKVQLYTILLALLCVSVYCNETTDILKGTSRDYLSPVSLISPFHHDILGSVWIKIEDLNLLLDQPFMQELEQTIDEARKLVQQTCQPKFKITDGECICINFHTAVNSNCFIIFPLPKIV